MFKKIVLAVAIAAFTASPVFAKCGGSSPGPGAGPGAGRSTISKTPANCRIRIIARTVTKGTRIFVHDIIYSPVNFYSAPNI